MSSIAQIRARRTDATVDYRCGHERIVDLPPDLTWSERLAYVRDEYPLCEPCAATWQLPELTELAEQGATAAVKSFLEERTSVGRPRQEALKEAVCAASFGDHLPVVELLVSHGALVDEPTWTGVLDHGADPERKAGNGQTTLELAEESGNAEAVAILARYRAKRVQ